MKVLIWFLPLTSAVAASLAVASGAVELHVAAEIGSVVVVSVATTMAAVGVHSMYSSRRAVVTSTTAFPVIRVAYVPCVLRAGYKQAAVCTCHEIHRPTRVRLALRIVPVVCAGSDSRTVLPHAAHFFTPTPANCCCMARPA